MREPTIAPPGGARDGIGVVQVPIGYVGFSVGSAINRPRKKRVTVPQVRAYTLDELRERWSTRRSDDPSIMSAQLKLMDIDEVSTVASGA